MSRRGKGFGAGTKERATGAWAMGERPEGWADEEMIQAGQLAWRWRG